MDNSQLLEDLEKKRAVLASKLQELDVAIREIRDHLGMDGWERDVKANPIEPYKRAGQMLLTNGELFDLAEKLESRVDRYWTFFSIAVLAVSGWLFTEKKNLGQSDALFVAAGLLIFFLGNFCVITLTEARILAVESEIEGRSQQANVLSPKFRDHLSRLSFPRRRFVSAVMHGIIDVVVIALVFLKP